MEEHVENVFGRHFVHIGTVKTAKAVACSLALWCVRVVARLIVNVAFRCIAECIEGRIDGLKRAFRAWSAVFIGMELER